MKKLFLIVLLFFLVQLFSIAQSISVAYEIGFSDVVFATDDPFGFTFEYNPRFGNAVFILGEWQTRNEQLTFLAGLTFGKHQLEEKVGPLTFLDDINTQTGATRTGYQAREITLKFVGVPMLFRLKKDWQKIQGFITGGPVFRRLNSLSSKQTIVYADGEIKPSASTKAKAIFDFSFYANIGCSKRLNEKLSLFLLTSVNFDLHNGQKEDENGLLGSGNIMHPAVSFGLGYDL